ncbi:hypothetical protein CJP74_03885 [Psittacicella melopsittaci]|uniref:HTH lysR-type domain-containing protein n=1 Tax=Psittacicella melopsittaci TaxID=2028576 RepID=A0A3A1Y332_9GAMM|nr:LysR family transcriptional regulator [Psittacicella melopsittaci]RIY32633.1 hypothetical protein CJP74_03885 [Psittacicella melopsittaci]
MNLDDVVAFIYAAQTGSFSQTAQKLGLTRSAVGKRIARLEESLKVRLMQRTTRSLTLTDEGKVFLSHSEQILEQLQLAQEALQQRVSTPTGRLRISAPVLLGKPLLNSLINKYLDLYPQVEIELSYSDRFVDLVAEGFDVAIRIGNTPASDQLSARYLGEYHQIAVATPQYLAHGKKINELEDLKEHSLLAYNSFNGGVLPWRFLNKQEKEVVFSPQQGKKVHYADNASFLLDLCLAHKGILYMPLFFVAQYLQSGQLVNVLPQYQPISSPMRIVYPSRNNLSPKVRALIDLLLEDPDFKALRDILLCGAKFKQKYEQKN